MQRRGDAKERKKLSFPLFLSDLAPLRLIFLLIPKVIIERIV